MQSLSQISSKDKKILMAGLAIVVLLASYLFFLEPLQVENEQLKGKLLSQYDQLEELQEIVGSIQPTRSSQSAKVSNESLLLIVDQSIEKFTIKPSLKRLTPIGNEKVNLSFESVSFKQFINWLVSVKNQYGIDVERLNLQKTDADLANIQLVLAI